MFKEDGIGKKGQITVFVIIAIAIIVGGVLVYQFAPGVKESVSKTSSPNSYMQDCLEGDLIDAVELIGVNGGSISPNNYYRGSMSPKEIYDRVPINIYDEGNFKLGYLCYTNEYHKYCTKEVAFLEEHIEEELLDELSANIDTCFNSLKEDFMQKGYTVSIKRGLDAVNLMSQSTNIISDTSISLTKGDSKISTDQISVVHNNNLYQLLGITRSIIEFESEIGEAEPMDYMQLYRGVKVEKHKQTDGTKIYILTNKKTEDSFWFASRSLVLPPGLIDPAVLE